MLLLVARVADAWLATWSEADAISPLPGRPGPAACPGRRTAARPAGGAGDRVTQTWPQLLTDLVGRRDLTPEAATWAMEQILAGDATNVQIAGFAIALRAKGETIDELTGLSLAMLARATPIFLPAEAVDVVGIRRRPRQHGQRVDDGRDRHGRRRGSGGQARQPGGLQRLRHGRLPRGARRGARPAPVRPGPGARQRPASCSCSRRCTTRRCATPRRPAASSACRPPSTSSARWPTRRVRSPRPSASRTPGWPR